MSCGVRATRGGDGLSGLTVKQLQQVLKDAGKNYKGNRAELCKRINELQGRSSSPRVTSPLRTSPVQSPKSPLIKSPVRRRRRANVLIVDSVEKTSPEREFSPKSPKRAPSPKKKSLSPPNPQISSRSPKSKGKEEEVLPPENPITSVTPAEEELESLRRQKLKHEKETNIMEALDQPFPKKFGLMSDGRFSQSMVAFSKGAGIKTAAYRMNLLRDSDLNFIDVMGLRDKIGKDCVFEIGFKQVKTENQSDEDIDLDDPYLIDLRNIGNKYLVFREEVSIYLNSKPEQIKECIQNGARILYLNVMVQYGEKAHIGQVIMNIGQKKGWFLDTSQTRKSYDYFRKSIEVFLQHYIDVNYILEPFNFDSCPTLKIQGQYDSCDGWTHYIFALAVLNPELTEFDILKIIASYDQETRNHLIIMFYAYFYSKTPHFKEQEIQKLVINYPKPMPSLENGEKLTFTRYSVYSSVRFG